MTADFGNGFNAAKVRFVIEGPTPDGIEVQAWADDYLKFGKLSPSQKQLREEIRARCRQLVPRAEQVLHATFFGAKLPNSDVENLAVYNIGSFKEAGANGIRLEYGADVPPAPDGTEFPFGYRYALAPRTGRFDHWRETRLLAQFDWTDLGAFAGEKKLAQVWLAITSGDVEVGGPIAPDTPFAVRVEVRPPHGRKPVWGGLVKGVCDGVISALQAHRGPLAPEVFDPLAKTLGVRPEDVEKILRNPPWTVLGEAAPLVAPYRSGVKWNPSDHLCVAGELIAAESEPGDDRWAIRGEVIEVARL